MLLNFLIGHAFARSRSVDELFGSRDYVKHSICITTCSRRAHEPITVVYIYIYIILNYRIGYHQVWESVFLLGWFDSLNCEKVRYPHCCNILCQYMRYGHFWGQIWKSGHTTIYRVSCSGNSVRFGGMMVIWALEHVHTWTSVGSCLTFYQLKARKPCCCPPVSGAGVGQVGWSSSCPPS